MEFKIEPSAFEDIQEQIDFYNSKQKGLGKKFYLEVEKYFKAIQKSPFYQVRYDNIRCLPLKKFPAMIHFIVDEKNKIIVVYAVISTLQNPDEHWVK